jgi:hypothetical protein
MNRLSRRASHARARAAFERLLAEAEHMARVTKRQVQLCLFEAEVIRLPSRKSPRLIAVDLMTGQIWDGDPIWPDECRVIPFRRQP